ncbi:hypothetical protein [Treponema vincentii]|uniref:hypothetical protein n=1 Tax=Treponema vincentii TaxID=69710 RepID=UPI0020A536F2|nr:hypothetical protein [Treponema vincentii]
MTDKIRSLTAASSHNPVWNPMISKPPDKPDSFANNWKNNSLDDFILLNDDTELFKCKCQSVANYCFGDMLPGDTVSYGDSIAAELYRAVCLRGNFMDKSAIADGR